MQLKLLAAGLALLATSCPVPASRAADVEVRNVALGSLPSDGLIEVRCSEDARVSIVDGDGRALAKEVRGTRVTVARRSLEPHSSTARVRVQGDGWLRVIAIDDDVRPFVSLDRPIALLRAGEPRAALLELDAVRGSAPEPALADALAAEAAFTWGRTRLAEHYALRGLALAKDPTTEARLHRTLIVARAEAVKPWVPLKRRSHGPEEDALDAAVDLRLAELDDRNLGGPPRAPAAARRVIDRAATLADVRSIAGALCRAGGHLNDDRAIARALAVADVAEAAICHIRRGDAAFDRDDLDGAEASYRRALDLLAGHPLPRELREAWFSYASVASARGDAGLAFARAREACRHVEVLLALEDSLEARDDLLRNVLGYFGSATVLGIRANDPTGAIDVAESGKSRAFAMLLHGGELDDTSLGAWFSRRSNAPSTFDRRVLRPGDVALSYLFVGGQKLAIGATTPQGSRAEVVSVPSELPALIAAHSAAIAANDEVAAAHLGARLHGILLAPVASSLSGARRLLVSPHLALHGLSFAALHDGSRFLVAQYAIARVPPLPLLTLEDRPVRSYVAAIAPVSPGMPLLPGSFTAPGALTFRGAEATGTRVLQADADGLIYAGHARYDEASPLESALLLSDGPLTSSAIIHARKRFDTVILIGCETARTQGPRPSYSDDAIGLSRAFLSSGARRVLGALWPLLDRDGEDVLAALSTHDVAEAQRCLESGACRSRGIAAWGSVTIDLR